MQDLDFAGFAAHLSRSGLRSTTIRKHLNCLNHLIRHNIPLTKDAVDEYLLKLQSENKRNAYLNMYVFALRHYGKYTNQDLHIKELKKQDTIKSTLSDDEIEAFLALPRRRNEPFEHYDKFKLFWGLVAFTGMRPGECAKLKPGHIDWGRGVILIETSKTNTSGHVPIPANIQDCLKKYLATCRTDFLFPSARGGSNPSMGGLKVIDNVDWHFDWKRRITILGIKRIKLTPYSFRHSYATRLLEENVSLFHVKKLMRHHDLKSTLVYEHLTTKDLIEAQQKLPLIRKASDPRKILQSLTGVVKGFHFEQDKRFTYELVEDENSIRFECSILEDAQ